MLPAFVVHCVGQKVFLTRKQGKERNEISFGMDAADAFAEQLLKRSNNGAKSVSLHVSVASSKVFFSDGVGRVLFGVVGGKTAKRVAEDIYTYTNN